jgi:hypothetical protein
MANVKKDAWEESLKAYTEKSQNEGITHFLIPQSDGKRIVHAALIRIGSLCEIWLAQRSPLPRKKEDQPRISGMDEEWKKNGRRLESFGPASPESSQVGTTASAVPPFEGLGKYW